MQRHCPLASLMPCGWEGNRRSGIALTMCHRLKWFIHLWAHGLDREMNTPTMLSCGVWPIYLLPYINILAHFILSSVSLMAAFFIYQHGLCVCWVIYVYRAKMAEPVEILFWVWTQVCPKDHVLNGGPDTPRGRDTFGGHS